MKYLWYTFLGLFSLGFLGIVAGAIIFVSVIGFYSQDLPEYSQLKDYEPAIVTRLYAGNGKLLEEFAREKRVFIASDAIPDHVKHAFISAEDQNFYSHPGIDLMAIFRASFVNVKNVMQGKRLIGASTITQQVAKNFLLTNERKLERKIREAILAIRMEQVLTKDQLIELYLNEIYFGARSYGVAAAALSYFQKSLEELTIAEAAYLAALPKAPNNYHPIRKRDAAIARRNWVIDRMAEDEYITTAQAELAKLDPLVTKQKDDDEVVNSPYFGEEVRRELIERYGEKSLYGGGLAVRTSIDPELQNYAVQTLRSGLMAYDKRHGYRGPYKRFETLDDWRKQLSDLAKPEGLLGTWSMAVVLEVSDKQATIGFAKKAKDPKGVIALDNMKWARQSKNDGYALGPEITAPKQVLKKGDVILVEAEDGKEESYILRQIPKVQGGLIALDPRNGRILAMQGGWKYGSSEFNRATQAMRQPGSAFKPFVYMAALDNGFTPATLVLDAPFVIEDRPGHFWKPSNYSGKFYGPTPIRIGVEKSKNLMTVRLADHLGMEKIADYARDFGITENMPEHLANSLGAGETTLLKMTAAYAMIANGGKRITPTFIDRIQDRYGKTILRHDGRKCPNCGQLIKWELQDTPDVPDTRQQITDPRTAYQMVSIMEGVVQRGTGVRLKSLARPLAGKTGTTNKSKDAWFIGFSPDLVVGVYVGFDEPKSLGKRETGSSAAVPIFKDFMEKALADRPLVPFRIPKDIRNVQINAKTGARARIGDGSVIWEAFKVGTEPTSQMYILDGRGISAMPDINSYMGDEYGTYDPNADPGFGDAGLGMDETYFGDQYQTTDEIDLNQDLNRRYNRTYNDGYYRRPNYQPPTQGTGDTSGTGGLY